MSTDLVTPWYFAKSRPERHHAYLLPALLKSLTTLSSGAHVLDMGCGSGFIGGQLQSLGFNITGIDASASGIRAARASHPQMRFEQTSVTDPALPSILNQTFDAVISVEVIEHLYSPSRFLENCRQVLKPGGTLIITTPYHGYFKNLLLALSGQFNKHFQPNSEGGHIKFWSPASLVHALKEHGFTPKRFDGCGRLPFVWKSMVITATH